MVSSFLGFCFCASPAPAPPFDDGALVAGTTGPPLTQPSSTLPSTPGISLFEMPKKNFSAVLRSLNVICVDAGVVWISVNSPMPCVNQKMLADLRSLSVTRQPV